MSARGFRDLQRSGSGAAGGRIFRHAGQRYLAAGGRGVGVKAGEAYVDVGTLNGYRTAMALLAEPGYS